MCQSPFRRDTNNPRIDADRSRTGFIWEAKGIGETHEIWEAELSEISPKKHPDGNANPRVPMGPWRPAAISIFPPFRPIV